jgi:hypothetical protein
MIKNSGEEWWVQLSLALLVIMCCFIWPSAIVVGPDSIEQHLWWHRSRKIPWNEVLSIQTSSWGEILVIAKQGKRIGFSRYHVDPRRFQNEVMRRANLKSVIDAAGPTGLRL